MISASPISFSRLNDGPLSIPRRRYSEPKSSGVGLLSAFDASEWNNHPLDCFRSRWWIAMCNRRHERRVARALDSMGIGCYVPMMEVRRLGPDGKRDRIKIPRFESYVFVNADYFSKGETRHNPKLRSSLLTVYPVSNQSRITSELQAFEIAEREGILIGPAVKMTVGTKCVIQPPHFLMGKEGYIIRVNRQQKFMLQVTDLQYANEVEIDPRFLEIVESAA
jgi:hypothetical protein